MENQFVPQQEIKIIQICNDNDGDIVGLANNGRVYQLSVRGEWIGISVNKFVEKEVNNDN